MSKNLWPSSYCSGLGVYPIGQLICLRLHNFVRQEDFLNCETQTFINTSVPVTAK